MPDSRIMPMERPTGIDQAIDDTPVGTNIWRSSLMSSDYLYSKEWRGEDGAAAYKFARDFLWRWFTVARPFWEEEEPEHVAPFFCLRITRSAVRAGLRGLSDA